LPTILVTNDDGINSIGLLALVKKLKTLGSVAVVAPKEEKSGIGKAISICDVNVIETSLDGTKAYAVTGTPADAFLLAINKILKGLPDLVVSGINIGPNLGIDDLLTSGTVGAAFEAAIHRVPAIAVSYCLSEITADTYGKNRFSLESLELAATFAYKTARHILERGMPSDVDIISINVPENVDGSKAKLTSLCYEGYGDIHSESKGGYGIKCWTLRHYPDGDPGTDLHAIKNEGCISITPIKVRFPHNHQAMKELLDYLSD